MSLGATLRRSGNRANFVSAAAHNLDNFNPASHLIEHMSPRDFRVANDPEWAKASNEHDDDENVEVVDHYQEETDNRSCLRRTFCGKPTPGCIFHNLLLVFIVVGGSVALLILYTGGGDPRVFFTQEDPPGYTEANRWSNANTPGRLELEITNSCEDRWTPAFDRYVQEWDSGSGSVPDVLQLTSSRLAYDFDCTEYRGRMNVCNGDYGNTDWRGINIAMLFNGVIISSVAKLNDFHLDQESEAQRLYTMCHEIGKFLPCLSFKV